MARYSPDQKVVCSSSLTPAASSSIADSFFLHAFLASLSAFSKWKFGISASELLHALSIEMKDRPTLARIE